MSSALHACLVPIPGENVGCPGAGVMAVSCHMGAGTKPGSSATAASAPNWSHLSSPTPASPVIPDVGVAQVQFLTIQCNNQAVCAFPIIF